MKHKLFTLLFALMAGIATMSAASVQIGDLYYTLYSTYEHSLNGESVTDYNCAVVAGGNSTFTGEIIIPETVKYDEVSYTIVEIGNKAFYDYSMTAVSMPNTVKRIGNSAFGSCSGLTSITIPNSVIEIGDAAFSNCTGLTEITIPVYVLSMKENAFRGCKSLTAFNVHSDNLNYSARNGVLFNKERTTLIQYPAAKSSPEYGIPKTVQTINSFAFDGCSNLQYISIPTSVTEIGEDAFRNCTGLSYFSIPNSVTKIGYYAFYGCSGLQEIEIPNTISSIASYTFYGCSGLTSVTIPNGVTSIGADAFEGCTGLTSITIPASVTSFGDRAFGFCSGLQSVVCEAETPPTVSIKYGLFYEVDKSIPLYVPAKSIADYRNADPWSEFTNILPIGGTEPCVTASGYCGGEGDGTNLAWELSCDGVLTISGSGEMADGSQTGGPLYSYRESINSIVLPDGLTSIGDFAFVGCSGLTSVTIPNSVTRIKYCAFESCRGLTSITCEATNPPTMEKGVFGNVNRSIPLYVPAGSVEDYHNASYWSEFTNILPIAGTEPCVTASGYCGGEGGGTNLAWELSCDGVLTISGSGEMANYTDKTPWYSYRESINTVVLPDGMTSIGRSAFAYCSSLTSITIPNSVTFIWYDAFVGCSLTSITIPNNVTNIGNHAFSVCTDLISITCLAQTPPFIASYTFYEVNKSIPLYVPAGSVEDYHNASYWSEFTNILPIGEPVDETPHHIDLNLQEAPAAIDGWTVNNMTLTTEKSPYIYSIEKDVTGEAYVTIHPDIVFRTMTTSGSNRAVYIYPNNCFQFGEKNGVVVVKNTVAGERIRLYAAAKSSQDASLEDPAGEYPKNAVTMATDLTLPGVNKGAEDADENGYRWRTIEYISLGGDVEIKEFATGYRIRRVEAVVDNQPLKVSEAFALGSKLSVGASTATEVHVRGYVKNPDPLYLTHMTQSFYMSDEASYESAPVFHAYNCIPTLGGQNMPVINWDYVDVAGRLFRSKETNTNEDHIIEIQNGPTTIIEPAEGERPVPEIAFVDADRAIQIALTMGNEETSKETYYVIGFVSYAKTYSGGTQSFWMSSDSTSHASNSSAFYVNSGIPDYEVKTGDVVIVRTRIYNKENNAFSESYVSVVHPEVVFINGEITYKEYGDGGWWISGGTEKLNVHFCIKSENHESPVGAYLNSDFRLTYGGVYAGAAETPITTFTYASAQVSQSDGLLTVQAAFQGKDGRIYFVNLNQQSQAGQTYQVGFGINPPGSMPANGIAVSGTFNNWQGTSLPYIEGLGIYGTVVEKVKADDQYLFHEAGNPDNYIVYYDEKEHDWLPVTKQTVSARWQEGTLFGISGKYVYMDFSGSNYAWKASLPDDPQIPTTMDFAGYDTKNNVILCVRFSGDAKVCNKIYFEGSFLDWNLVVKYEFSPFKEFDGWYVASVPYSSGTVISGKPVQMNADGTLSWDNQAGDKNAWTHMGGLQAEITDGDKDECEVTYPSAGVYIYDISYWKAHANPCYEQVYTVGVAVTPPVGTPEAGIELYGSFSEKAVPMEKSGDYWYAIIQTTASQTFGFREKNNPSNPIMKYFPDKGEWGTVSGMRFRDYWQDGAAYGYEGMYVMMDLSGSGYKWQDYVEPDPEPQPQCYFDIDMYDGYGDGWTGAEIVVVEGEKTTRYTLEDGVNERVQVPYYGEPVSFYWSAGPYDEEVSFSILASDGEGLFRVEEGTVLEDKQLLYTMEVSPCATGDNPFIPQNLRSTLTENGGLFIQWDEVSDVASYKVSVLRVDGYAIAVNKPVTDAYAYFSDIKVGGSYTITVMSCDENGEQLGESSIMQVIDRPAVDGVTVHAYVPYGCTVNTKSGLWLAWREPGSKKWENSHIVSMKREKDRLYTVTFNPGIAAYDYLILNSSKFNTSSSSFQYSYHWSALTATEHCCILGNVESNNRFELYESADCSMENYDDYGVSDLYAETVSVGQVKFRWSTEKVSSLYQLNIYSSDNVLLKTIAVENSKSYIWNVDESYTNQDLKWSLRPMKPYELAEKYGNTLYLKQSGEQETIHGNIETNDNPNNPTVHIEWEDTELNASQYRVEVEWNGIVIYSSTTGYTYCDYMPVINGVFEVYVQPLDENGNPIGYRVLIGRFILRNVPGPIYNTRSSANEHHLSFSWSKRFYVSAVKATLYQWNGDRNYTYITEAEQTANTYEYDAPEDGAYVLRLQPIIEYNGQYFVLPLYSSIIAKAFTTQTYPVLLTSGEGGSIQPEDISGEYPEGYMLTAIAEPEEGYYFAGWSDGKTTATRHIYVDKEITLHASFQPLCRLYLNAEHGTVSLSGGYDKRIGNMYYVRPGKELTLKAYPDYEYKFTQWSDGEQTIQRFVTITSDTVFTALFEEAPIPWYKVSIYSNQPKWGSVSDHAASYPEGTKLYIRATPNEGYAFKEWSDGVTVNPRTITVNTDVYLAVDFEVKKVNLTVTAGTGGSVNSDVNGQYTYGDYVVLHAMPDDGYVFAFWSDGSVLADRQLRLRRDLRLTAYFAKEDQPDPQHPVMYSLFVKSANGGKVNTEVNGTYEKGTQVMVAAMADNEWKFDRWSDGDRHAIRLLTMKKDYSLTAYFVSTKKYKVTVTAGANGTVRPAVRDAEYTGGSVLRVRAFPNAGYKLSSWSDGNTETIRDVVIYQDTVITASFTVKPKYNVSVVAGEGGTVTPLLNNIPCEEGSTIHLEAKPNEGYRFKEWSDGNKKAVRDVLIKQDTSLTAYFTKIPVYKVTVKAASNGVVIPPLNMAEYYEGATVHIEASPNSGYKFKEWSDGNTDAVRDIVITSDTTLIARFYAFITYTLRVEIQPKEAGYVLFDGEKINNSQTVVAQGTEVELTARANDGYSFEYFVNDDDRMYSTRYIVEVTDDMTVTAVFKKKTEGIDLIDREPDAEYQKIIIDSHLYILRDGCMYDAMGKRVK